MKLTLERIITAINKTNKTAESNKVVDQTWNCKKIDTIKRIRINNLFLGSNLWVNVPNGVYLPNVMLLIWPSSILESDSSNHLHL